MSASDVRKLQEEREKERTSGSKDTWAPKFSKGVTIIRLGPPWKKHGEFWKDRYIHGYFKHKVQCAQNDIDKETGKPRKCKVCRRLRKVKGDMSDEGRALFKLFVQRREGLWNVVFGKFEEHHGKFKIVGLKKPKKWQILQFSQQWANELTEIFAEEDYREDSKYGVTDLEKGRWIKVTRKHEGLDTEYRFHVMKEAGPISESSSTIKELEKSIINLDRFVKGSTDEELESFIEDMEKEARKQVKNSKSGSSRSKSKSKSDSKSSSSEEEKKKSKSKSDSKSKSKSKSESSSDDASKVLKEMNKSVKDKSKKESKSDDKKSSKKSKSKKESSSSKSKSKSKSSSKSKSKSKSDSSSKSESKSKSKSESKSS